MNIRTILLFLLVIFSMKYFDASFARTGILKNLAYAAMGFGIILSLSSFFKYKGGFAFPIQLISASIVISMFMASYTWGQGLEYSPTTIPYLIWFVFFYLIGTDVPIKTIEKIILIYGALYIILFLFQFTHNDTVYFGTVEEFKEDRGVIRVNFPGGGVFFLSCYIAINKATSSVKYRWIWLSVAIIGVVVSVLQVTRQNILLMLLIYFFHFMRNMKLQYKILTVVLFLSATYGFLNSDNTISRGLAEQQKTDASAGSEYIRILSAQYYLTQFTPNTISKIFGNGFFNDTSNYGKALISLNENYGYYLTDVGIVEVYITFGVFAVFGYLLIFAKSIILPLPEEYAYLKYYLWMIALTCFSSDFLISYNYLISTVFVLYCYHKLTTEQNHSIAAIPTL